MKIVVDLDLCQTHGRCVELAPTLFEIRDDGFLHVLIETPSPALEEEAEQAALQCPAGAISLTYEA